MLRHILRWLIPLVGTILVGIVKYARFALPLLALFAGYLYYKSHQSPHSLVENVKVTAHESPLSSGYIHEIPSTMRKVPLYPKSELPAPPPVSRQKPRKLKKITVDFDMGFLSTDSRIYRPPSSVVNFALVCTYLRPADQDFKDIWSTWVMHDFKLPNIDEENYYAAQVEKIQKELTDPQSWSSRAAMAGEFPVFLIRNFPSTTPLIINAVTRLPINRSACSDLFAGYYGFHRYYLKLTFSYQ